MADLCRLDREGSSKKEKFDLDEVRETARQMLEEEYSRLKEQQVQRAWGRSMCVSLMISKETGMAGAEEVGEKVAEGELMSRWQIMTTEPGR